MPVAIFAPPLGWLQISFLVPVLASNGGGQAPRAEGGQGLLLAEVQSGVLVGASLVGFDIVKEESEEAHFHAPAQPGPLVAIWSSPLASGFGPPLRRLQGATAAWAIAF